MKKRKYLIMIMMLVIMMPFWVKAAETVSYLDEFGKTQTITNYKELEPYITWDGYNTWISIESGWYVVTGDTLINGIKCNGDIKIILKDNAHLTVGGVLAVNSEDKLTIYSQSLDEKTMGKLSATGGNSDAGIGGDGSDSGTIIINGGYITAKGGKYGAGIGGDINHDSGEIIINNGIIHATGGSSGGAGIGGGSYGGNGTNITINGGTVVATGGVGEDNYQAAGIGGGYNGTAKNIVINGGDVTATASHQKYCIMYSSGNGIGGGAYKDASDIVINGGNVTATANCKTAIGGNFVIADNLKIYANDTEVDASSNYVSALNNVHVIKIVDNNLNLSGTIKDNSTTVKINIAIVVASIIIIGIVLVEIYFSKKKKNKKVAKKNSKKTTKTKKKKS